MAIRFCPECKQMVPPGKLRSASQSCVACFRRTSPDDLILLDDNGKVIEQVAPKQVVSQEQEKTAQRSMWEDEPDVNQTVNEPQNLKDMPNDDIQALLSYAANNPDDLSKEQISKILSYLAHTTDLAAGQRVAFGHTLVKQLDNMGVFSFDSKQQLFDDTLPEPEPWDRIALPHDTCWDSKYGIPTIVLKDDATLVMFIIGICWCAIVFLCMIGIVVEMLDSERIHLDDVFSFFNAFGLFVFFLAVGGVITYLGARLAFSKTWLDLSESVIIVEHGVSRKGKQISVPRDPKNVKVVASQSSVENGRKRYRIEYVWGTERAVLAGDASLKSAQEIFKFAKALLVAIV